jgi:hypothetical protein
MRIYKEELDGPAVIPLRRAIAEVKQRWSVIGPKHYYLKLLRPSAGTLSRWSRLHLQSLAPTNSHWARVVGYGPLSLCVIHKEGRLIAVVNVNVNTVNSLVAFYDIQGRKGEVLFFYSVPDTTRDYNIL